MGEHRGPFGAEGVEEGVHGGGGAAGRGPCPCAAAPFRRTPVCQGPAGAVAALAVMGRRRSSLPVGISHADATALLGSCDRRVTGADQMAGGTARGPPLEHGTYRPGQPDTRL